MALIQEFVSQPELGCAIAEISYSRRIRTGCMYVACNAGQADIGAIVALFRQWDTQVQLVHVYGADGSQYRAGLDVSSGIWRMDAGNTATCNEDRRNYAERMAHIVHNLTQDGRKPWEEKTKDEILHWF